MSWCVCLSRTLNLFRSVLYSFSMFSATFFLWSSQHCKHAIVCQSSLMFRLPLQETEHDGWELLLLFKHVMCYWHAVVCTFATSSYEEYWGVGVEVSVQICWSRFPYLPKHAGLETTCAVVHPGFSLNWLSFSLVFFCGFAFSSFFLLFGFSSSSLVSCLSSSDTLNSQRRRWLGDSGGLPPEPETDFLVHSRKKHIVCRRWQKALAVSLI